MIWIGVISDTHGLLRPEVLRAFHEGDPRVELILHAGDVGSLSVLDGLATLAPVRAVRGNVDGPPLSARLPETDVIEVGGLRLYLLHDLSKLDLDPAAAGLAAVVFGHSHEPACYRKDGLLYLNPGSAGPRRHDLPVGIARLGVDPERKVVSGELLSLGAGGEGASKYRGSGGTDSW